MKVVAWPKLPKKSANGTFQERKAVRITQRLCKAKGCDQHFTPSHGFVKWCSPECGYRIWAAKKEQDEQRQRSDERKKDREKRDKLKTRSDYMKDAQREFNKFIRHRDSGQQCISCTTVLALEAVIGGGYDCGHFRSVGSAPHLRFDPRNAAGQCKKCNRYGSGRVVEFRKGLIARHGLAFVDELESDQAPQHYAIEDLKQIISKYRQMTREILKEKA